MSATTTPGSYALPFTYDEVAAFLDRVIDPGVRGADPAPRFADVAADLARLELPAGTPIVIAMANGRRLLEQYFAALFTGAVPVLVSPATPSARIRRLVQETGAGAVVAARLDPTRYGVDSAVSVGDAAAVLLPHAATGRHPSGTALMLTSGTSGLVSACLHRVDSLVRNARRHAEAVGLRGDDTVLVTLPLFFSYAVVAQAFAALVTGARLVVSGPPFVPASYVDSLSQYSVTSSSVTPTIARALLAGEHRLPAGLRMLTVGGDRLDPRHVTGLLAAGSRTELYVTYGLTEAGPRVSTLAAHQEPVSRHGSVGLPLDGVTVSLRPTARDPHPTAAVGTARELVVTADTVLLAKVGSGPGDRGLIGPGVVATGDLFRIDDEGYLFFEGRISDFVVLRGEKVSLFAVRQFVQSLPGIVRCTTELAADADGTAYYDLRVHVADGAAGDPAAAARRIRQETNTFLLAGERPRSVVVDVLEPAAFRK